MTIGSKINTNFPIPGVDQSSKGFRDNFSIIKQELEDIQSKNIQLVGSLISDPVQIGNSQSDIIIPVVVNLANVQASGSNTSVQYNLNNSITGSQIYYNNGKVGINTNSPVAELTVIGNIIVSSTTQTTSMQLGSNLNILTSNVSTNVNINNTTAISINNSNLFVGIGTSPVAVLDVWSNTNDIAIIRGSKNNSDNAIRFTTDQTNSSIGLALEQQAANKVGGIRIDQLGNVSIHVNENTGADLSNSSRVINILPNYNVGIGSMSPTNKLDVEGNVHISGVLTVGSTPIITGSRASGGALSNLLAALSSMGLIINNTTT